MTAPAQGTFEVSLVPLTADAAWGGFRRMSMDKRFQGDLEGTSRGQMMAAHTSHPDSAGYVALERVTGVLRGRRGSFVLQHSGSMDRAIPTLAVSVVPGSGTGELEGISGTMAVRMEGGGHAYTFTYQLPRSQGRVDHP